MKRILFYGDSNTWGYNPANRQRFDEDTRWTCVAARLLGTGYHISEAGLVGRTTRLDDPTHVCANGKKALGYSLLSQKPLDLLVLMLGSNDLKFVSAREAADGVEELMGMIETADETFPSSSRIFSGAPSILLISPILVHTRVTHHPSLAGAHGESTKFGGYWSRIAETHHAAYLDAARYGWPSELDGLHMEAEAHLALGRAVADKILEIFGESGHPDRVTPNS